MHTYDFLCLFQKSIQWANRAIFNNSQNAFKAIHNLLESNDSLKLFEFLGLLMQTPLEINSDDFKCNKNIAEGIIHYYEEDSGMDIPTGMFGMSEMESMALGRLKIDVASEAYFNIYMKKIIDEKRNAPETKKCFVNKLIKKYYKEIKEEYNEIHNELMEDEE